MHLINQTLLLCHLSNNLTHIDTWMRSNVKDLSELNRKIALFYIFRVLFSYLYTMFFYSTCILLFFCLCKLKKKSSRINKQKNSYYLKKKKKLSPPYFTINN